MAIDETRMREIVRAMIRQELLDFTINPNQILPARANDDPAVIGDSLKFDGESVAFEA